MTPTERPQVGQTWEDCDARMSGRRMVVVRVTETHAYLEHPMIPTVRTRILLRRMRPNNNRGWRLVE